MTYDYRTKFRSILEGKDIVHFWCHNGRHADNRRMSNDIQDLYAPEDWEQGKQKYSKQALQEKGICVIIVK